MALLPQIFIWQRVIKMHTFILFVFCFFFFNSFVNVDIYQNATETIPRLKFCVSSLIQVAADRELSKVLNSISHHRGKEYTEKKRTILSHYQIMFN